MLKEKQIQNKILREYATRSDMRLWRGSTGKAVPLAYVRSIANAVKSMDYRTAERLLMSPPVLSFGLTGQADLSGILGDGFHPSAGTRIEIEVKSETGRQSKEQAAFQGMIERFGGLYVLARSVEDVEKAL